MFTIEKNVPLIQHTSYQKNQYPFMSMKAGDSFLVTGEKAKKNTVAASVYYYNKKTGWKFVQRKVENGIRVWRLE